MESSEPSEAPALKSQPYVLGVSSFWNPMKGRKAELSSFSHHKTISRLFFSSKQMHLFVGETEDMLCSRHY